MTSELRCVAIETATAQASLAACSGERVEQTILGEARSSSRQLFPLLNELLERLDLQPAQLDCVAFGCGPGGFTGVRVAASAAQGLAYATGQPVCRISTLAALALAAAREEGDGDYVVCTDARMGEVYMGSYSVSAGGVTSLQADALIDPQAFAADALPGNAIAAGDGWAAYPALLQTCGDRIGKVLTEARPDAAAVLQLARLDYAAGNTVQPHEALPNYLRNSVTG